MYKTKNIKTLIAIAIISTSLSGCGVLEKLSTWPPANSSDNYSYPQEADSIPVNSWATPPQTVTAQPLPNMAPAQGLQAASIADNMDQPLGTEEIRQRFQIMEQQIGIMRKDMENIAPLLSRLAVIEQSMRELSHALNNAPQAPAMANKQPTAMHNNNAMPMDDAMKMKTMPSAHAPYGVPHNHAMTTAHNMPVPIHNMHHNTSPEMNKVMKVANAPAKQMPKQMSSAATSVKGIRFGKYKGRDRIVLDLTAPAKFRYDLDNNEKLLIVELPSASWTAQMAKQIKTSSKIAAYSAQPGVNGGTQLIFSLKGNARVSQARELPPNKTYGHRIFMDIE